MVEISQERAKAIAALAALVEQGQSSGVREDGWVDVYDMMAACNVGRSTAMERLNELVDKGRAETKMVIDKDRHARVRVWRMVGKP